MADNQGLFVISAEQREELRALARSFDREEADRARAILLSLEGWTSERIAAAFGVRTDSVRSWWWIFGRKGVAGLRAKAQAALSVIEPVLAPDVAERANWTLPRLQDEIERRTGERIAKSRLSVVLKKGVRLATTPTHAALRQAQEDGRMPMRLTAPGCACAC